MRSTHHKVLSVVVACAATVSCGSGSSADDTIGSPSKGSAISTPPPTTTVAAETTLATTTTVAGGLDSRLIVTPLDVPVSCPPATCGAVTLTAAGQLVVFDRSLATLTFVDEKRVVAVNTQFDADARLLAMGPDDVAYFAITFEEGPFGTVAAVATSGPMSGAVVGRGEHGIFMAEFTLAFTAVGLVTVVCCDNTERHPRIDEIVASKWVSSTGEPVVLVSDIWLEYPTVDEMVVVRSDGGVEQRWTSSELHQPEYMPPVRPTDDGGVLMWFDAYRHEGFGGSTQPSGLESDPAVLYDLLPDGSIETYITDPSYQFIAMNGLGVVIVFDGEQYLRLQLP